MKNSLAVLGTSSLFLVNSLSSFKLQDGFFDYFVQSFSYITKSSIFQKINIGAFVASLAKIAYTVYKDKKTSKAITKDVNKKNNSLFEKLENLKDPVENANKFAGYSGEHLTQLYQSKELAPIDYHDSVQYRALKSSGKGYITEFNFDSDVTAIMSESAISDNNHLAGHLAIVDECFDMIDMHKTYIFSNKKPEKNAGIVDILKENYIIPIMTTNSKMTECKVQPSRKFFGISCGIMPAILDNLSSIGIGVDMNGMLRFNSISCNLFCLISQKCFSRLGLDYRGPENVTQIGLVTKSIETLKHLHQSLTKKENKKIDPTGFFSNAGEDCDLQSLKIGYMKNFIDNKPEFMIESQNKSISNLINFLSSRGCKLIEVKCERPSKIFKDFYNFMKIDNKASNDAKFSKTFLRTWSDLELDFMITPISNIALPKKLNEETLQYAHDFLSIANRTGLSAGTIPLYKIDKNSEIFDESSPEAKLYADEIKDSIGLYTGVQVLGRAYDESRLVSFMQHIDEMKR